MNNKPLEKVSKDGINTMKTLVYPTEFRGRMFRVVNPEFNEGTDINVNFSDLCPDLDYCDGKTDVCHNDGYVNCGFYMLRRGF